jgi:hypothetical protein
MPKRSPDYGTDDVGEFIVVQHTAGKRASPNRVKKYRAQCEVCEKDRGWVFKAYLKGQCVSCSARASYLVSEGRALNNNDNGLKTTKLLNGKQVELKSSYELFVFNYLKASGKKFSYEPEAFLLPDGGTYRPDFYWQGRYIEVKGLMRQEDEIKMKAFKKANPRKILELWDRGKLESLGYKEHLYKKLLRFNVLGTTWWFEFMDFKQYLKKNGSKSKAITNVDEKIVYFNIRECDDTTIRHELAHVYAAAMGIVELQLDDDQIEELFCELVGRYSFQLLKRAEVLNGALNSLKDRIINDSL